MPRRIELVVAPTPLIATGTTQLNCEVSVLYDRVTDERCQSAHMGAFAAAGRLVGRTLGSDGSGGGGVGMCECGTHSHRSAAFRRRRQRTTGPGPARQLLWGQPRACSSQFLELCIYGLSMYML